MLFGWKKTVPEKNAEKASLVLPSSPDFYRQQLVRPRSLDLAVSFENVDLGTQFRSLNYDIPFGSWVLLLGPNLLSKAIFCDLCFGFIRPDRGIIQPRLSGADVSFLGRAQTTYGISLLDHLTSGVKERSRGLLAYVASQTFGTELHAALQPDAFLVLRDETPLLESDLNERSHLEIAEANVLLQNRPAVIVDTSSDFYRNALEQGFRHSELFRHSGKTIFWLVDDEYPLDEALCPWQSEKQIRQLSLYFAPEALLTNIN